jgi:hypothetical protein
MAKAPTLKIENVLQPGKLYTADAAKYEAMKKAMLAALPAKLPGMTVAEMQQAVLKHLPDDLFPGGAKSGWWTKAVQLDLEAKKIIVREQTKPLRLRKA